MNLLKIEFIGNLGKDAIVNDAKGKKVTSFSVAVNQDYVDKNKVKHESVIWVDCAIWNYENIDKYLKKGTLVYIEGTPTKWVSTQNKSS